MSITRAPHRPTRVRAAVLLLAGVLLAACGQTGGDAEVADEPGEFTEEAPADDVDDPAGDTEGATTEEAAPAPFVDVVATVAPVADLVARVGGERVDVESLVPAGVDAHTYEPRPSDVMTLAGADLYVGIGLGLNDGALRMAEEHLPADGRMVLLGERALADADLVFDHSHDHSHDDDHGHSHDDDEPGPNPHVWTSLANTRALVGAIAETLREADPDGAATYAANRDAFLDELDTLDEQIHAAVDTIPDHARSLVTYHDAWAYFARDHDLDYEAAVQPTDFTDPSASEVREVIDLIRERDVPAVFGSEEFPTPVLEAIAEETGARYIDGLADDVLPGAPGDPEHSYLELMRRNAIAIVDGLGGDPSGLR